jgi:hypothetical protein
MSLGWFPEGLAHAGERGSERHEAGQQRGHVRRPVAQSARARPTPARKHVVEEWRRRLRRPDVAEEIDGIRGRKHARRRLPERKSNPGKRSGGRHVDRAHAPEVTAPHRAEDTTQPPVLILGVSRSGTTLLKEMLDRHSALAIPSESYFIPQLWDRHGERSSVDDVVEDLGRIARVREWGVAPDDVRARLAPGAGFNDVVDAVYRAYAESRGKARYGDKTPSYMQHLRLLERVFPAAQFVHIVRDGRDAGLSFMAMKRKPRFNLGRPRRLLEFACAWRLEVEGARRFGARLGSERYLELRYEDLVGEPEARLGEVCRYLGLELEPAQLEYHHDVDPGRLQDHPRLAEPPTKDVRRWREEMSPRDQEVFEAVAGGLLSELGYERAYPEPSASARARAAAELAAFRARVGAWTVSLRAFRRSPVWRVRQAYVRRSPPAE